VVAVWSLLLALCGIALYFLAGLHVLAVSLTERDHIVFLIRTTAGLLTGIGLWKLLSWGWAFAVLFTFLSWLATLFDLLSAHAGILDLAIAPFILIDAFITRYLYRPEVRQVFKITSPILMRLDWIPTSLFLFAVWLIARNLITDVIALATILVFFLGLRTLRWHRKRRKKT
jgi:hypothetical protein